MVVVACALAVGAVGPISYRLVEIAVPGVPNGYYASAINDRREVAVGGPHGYLWVKGVLSDMGPPPDRPFDDSRVVVNALNNHGVAVGAYGIFTAFPIGLLSRTGFHWSGTATGYQRIDGDFSEIMDVNDAGDMAGDNGAQGFIKSHGHTRDLIALSDDPSIPRADFPHTSNVVAINRRGVVAGTSTYGPGPDRFSRRPVVAWLKDDGLVIRPLRLPVGITNAVARDITDDGTVLATSGNRRGTPSAYLVRDGAVSWVKSPPGIRAISAYAMNNQGLMIGVVNPEARSQVPTPYLWVNGEPRPFAPLVTNRAGWSRFRLANLNDRGDICGVASRRGVTRPVVFLRQ